MPHHLDSNILTSTKITIVVDTAPRGFQQQPPPPLART